MNAMMYGGLIGVICGVVWAVSGFNGVLLVLALGIAGGLIGALISKFGGLKSLISQLVSDE